MQGPGGATAGFYVGKFLTNVVGHGTIVVLTAIATATGDPGAGATTLALEKTFAVPIEALSNVVVLGCGMIGGVLTGPA